MKQHLQRSTLAFLLRMNSKRKLYGCPFGHILMIRMNTLAFLGSVHISKEPQIN